MSKYQGLGGRLVLLQESDLDEAQRGVLKRLRRTQVPEARAGGFIAQDDEGQFVGPFNAYLHFPRAGAALLDWALAQVGEATLSRAAREVVILAVGAVWQAPYEVQAHTAAARSVGLSAEAVAAALRRQDSDELPKDARAARRIADALLVDHAIPDDLYRQATGVLGAAGVAAIAHLVGQYVAISALLISFAVPSVPPTS